MDLLEEDCEKCRFLLCLLICFPVVGKEKNDSAATGRWWPSKKKIIFAGILCTLAVVLASWPRQNPSASAEAKALMQHLIVQTLEDSDERCITPKKYSNASLPTCQFSSVRSYKKIYFVSLQGLRVHLFLKALDLDSNFILKDSRCRHGTEEDHKTMNKEEKARKLRNYKPGMVARAIKEKGNYYNLLSFDRLSRAKEVKNDLDSQIQFHGYDKTVIKLDEDFFYDVARQKIDLINEGGDIKNQLVYPGLKCLALCLERKSESLPKELSKIVQEYTLPILTLQLPAGFRELRKPNSIMCLNTKESLGQFADRYKPCIDLDPSSYTIRAVGPNGEDVTKDLT